MSFLPRATTEIARAKSAQYTEQLLEILDTPAIRQTLNATCPDLAHEHAKTLLTRILEELSVSELMHTFQSDCNNEGDTNLPVSAQGQYLYNIWQVPYHDSTCRHIY